MEETLAVETTDRIIVSLTDQALHGEIWASQPAGDETGQASQDREDHHTPPPYPQVPQANDELTEEEEICQFDWEEDEPPEGTIGVA